VKSLDAVSLRVHPGEFVAIRGPSGCGKTTLLLTVGGMLRPSSGTVTVAGHELYALRAADRARWRSANLGFIFQMFHLVPYLTVLENVLLAAGGPRTPERIHRSRELLDQLGLAARLSHKPAELSAGERQRTAIARALLGQPQILLADEPTGNLDPHNAVEVFQHLRAFHQAGGTVIVVTHGDAAQPYAQRTLELQAGRLHSAS
jgi:ABC-type lipoprotein export system ATPase subunit